MTLPANQSITLTLDEVLGMAAERLPSHASGDRESVLWCAVVLALVDDPRHGQSVLDWFGLYRPPPDGVQQLAIAARTAGLLTAYTAGPAFERRSAGRAAPERRDNGVYFTPPELARFVVEQTLAPLLSVAKSTNDLMGVTVCDPAAGAGAFALQVIDTIAERAVQLSSGLTWSAARRLAMQHCVYLLDADPLAVALLRGLIYVHVGDPDLDPDLVAQRVVAADAVIGPPPRATQSDVARGTLDWTRTFPEVFEQGGFSAVVGNPPWGTVKPASREWFGARDERVSRLQGAAFQEHVQRHHRAALDEWDDHRASKRAYAATLRSRAGYVHQGSGDTDFYRFFIERSHQVLRPGGRLGVVVPSALQRAEGSAPLRRLLFESGTAELMLDFLNTRRLFQIHSMFRFLVLVWQRGPARGVSVAAFGLRDVNEARAYVAEGGLRFELDYLRRVSGSRLSVPEVRDRAQAELFGRLHLHHPPIGVRDETSWNVRFTRELDMTNDSRAFVDVRRARAQGAVRGDDGCWIHPELGRLLPLYEGRMVHQFDAAAKRYLGGHGRAARWKPLLPQEKSILPHYLVPEDVVQSRGVRLEPRAGFCDVTGHANERTVLAALVPALAVCGNKVPTCRFDSPDERLPLMWLGLANSLIVDWLVRRRVSTTLNFFHWEQIPFPRLDPSVGAGEELVLIARELSENPHRPWAPGALTRRAALRASADALVAEVFQLEARDLAVILADFPLLDRMAPAGERGTITRDLVLHAFALRTGHVELRLSELGIPAGRDADIVAERVAGAGARGEIGYVPGELAAELRRASADNDK